MFRILLGIRTSVSQSILVDRTFQTKGELQPFAHNLTHLEGAESKKAPFESHTDA